jgi:hypothetical protein
VPGVVHCLARTSRARRKMLDLVYVAVTVVFFVISIAYVRACEK